MRRLVIFALLFCCAHEPPAAETELAAEQPSTFAEGVTPPVRKRCRKGGPRLGARDRARGKLILDYVIGEDGRVREVEVAGDASAGAVKAIRAFLATCRYQPAMQGGRPVPVKWKGELTFPD